MSDYLPNTNAEALILYKKEKDCEQDFEQSEIRWIDSTNKTQKTYLPAYEDESPERLLYVVREYIDFCKDIEIHLDGNDNAKSV